MLAPLCLVSCSASYFLPLLILPPGLSPPLGMVEPFLGEILLSFLESFLLIAVAFSAIYYLDFRANVCVRTAYFIV
jgi:hypothetical protein